MKISDFLQVFKEYGDIEIIVNETPLKLTNVIKFLDKEIKEISFEVGTFKSTDKIIKRINISLVKECE